MLEIDYLNLLGVVVIATLAPLVVDALRAPVPDVVAMILCGVLFGTSGLGWIEIDVSVQLLSSLGLAYLLFVSGLEIRAAALRGRMSISMIAFGVSLALALAFALVFHAAGLVSHVGIMVAVLITTSLGIVVVLLKEEGRLATPMGQLTLLGASLGDFASVGLLSVLFSERDSPPELRVLLLVLFGVAVFALAAAARHMSVLQRLRRALSQRAHGASRILIRASFALMVGFAALASAVGLEAILGAFAAGVVVSVVSDRVDGSDELEAIEQARGPADVREQLETIGFGLMAPLFFVTAGLRFDLGALAGSAEALALVPLTLIAMIATRALPALLFARLLDRREMIASGLLMSVKLTFVVAAVQIGREAGALSPAAASAIISAAMISIVTLPTIVRWMLPAGGQPLPLVDRRTANST
ncbi:MAG TPA: cation:proton antiporter [Solirubrobacteraceae bacterium]|nr:cation:proton antiporter [Solirubrobacteraceae bacterium]